MNTLREYLQSIGVDTIWAVFFVAVGMALVLAGLIWVAINRMQNRLKKIPFNDKFKRSSLLLSALCRIKSGLVFVCVFLSVLSYWSILGATGQEYAVWIVMVLAVFQIGLVVDGVLQPLSAETRKLHPSSSIGTIGLFLSRLALWTVLSLIVLDNFGIKITALLAGLGVGGVAVALAIKSILEDLFASLTIALDKPFATGDALRIGDFVGTVETIGLKTTHLRSIDGEMLIFPNADLLQSRLRNFGRMQERRVLFVISVTYETSPTKLQKACKIIEDVVSSHEKARLDRVHFLNFNASSLDIEVVYWVRSPKYDVYVDLRQSINFGILEKYIDEGIEFAYPTQRTIGEFPSISLKEKGPINHE